MYKMGVLWGLILRSLSGMVFCFLSTGVLDVRYVWLACRVLGVRVRMEFRYLCLGFVWVPRNVPQSWISVRYAVLEVLGSFADFSWLVSEVV